MRYVRYFGSVMPLLEKTPAGHGQARNDESNAQVTMGILCVTSRTHGTIIHRGNIMFFFYPISRTKVFPNDDVVFVLVGGISVKKSGGHFYDLTTHDEYLPTYSPRDNSITGFIRSI